MTDGRHELEKRLRAAARYEKGLFGARWASRILPLVAGGAIVVAAASLTGFAAGPEILRFGCLAGLVVLAVAGARVSVVRIQREASAKCLDRIMGFPDSALAVVQLAGSGSAWAEAVTATEIPRILGRPCTLPGGRWRWLNWSALMAAALLVGVLWPWPSREHGEQAPAAATEQAMRALQETLRDWERVGARENAPVAQVLNEAAESLRNALHARSAGLGEVMVRVARAEDRLRSARGSLAALRSLSPALARALSGISPRATEALAGNDFTGAADALTDPSFQTAAPSEEAASELERLARSLGASGMAALADALGNLVRAGSPQESAEALGQMSAALREAGALAQSEPLLDSAEMRLSSARERMGGSAERGRAEEDSSKGNDGAGTSSQGDSKVGESPRPSGAPALLAPIPGRLLGQGPTQLEILPSDTGAPENPATPARGSRAVEGELSSEVILPESLPQAYHGIVRRYFEILRDPKNVHEP